MAEHTPGPWSVGYRFGSKVATSIWQNNPPGDPVASVTELQPPSERTANAHLIAAAPDLLAACEAALAHLTDPASTVTVSRYKALTEQLRVAIARAYGEGPE
jgi:hypothetical protein